MAIDIELRRNRRVIRQDNTQSFNDEDESSDSSVEFNGEPVAVGDVMRNRLLGVEHIDVEIVNDIMNRFPSLGALIHYLSYLSTGELSHMRPSWRHLFHHYGPYDPY